MKRILALAALSLAASSTNLGQMTTPLPSPSPSPAAQPPAQARPAGDRMAAGGVEQAILQLERDLQAASLKNDTALFEKVATDDYVVTNPVGMVGSKAESVASAKNFKIESLNTDDVKVRVYGDSAVVTGRATLKAQMTMPANAAQDISGQYRYTRVYVKQGGQWRLAAFHLSPVAQQPAR